MSGFYIHNARIINEGRIFDGSVVIENDLISEVISGSDSPSDFWLKNKDVKSINAGGNFLIPGVIDDQVHFREPGLTHKADIYSESKAAVAGGVTSFMDMPNTIPQTITNDLLHEKLELAANKSLANFSFYLGATNDNLDELLNADPSITCGIKIFMGASTGNMLVDNDAALNKIFGKSKLLIAIHSEYEPIIRANTEHFKKLYGENIPVKFHPMIRSAEACFVSTDKAIKLARKHNSRLHVLHLSTEEEMKLFDNSALCKEKRITAEVCVHHLWFDDKDYEKLGTLIKWNPAIKKESDKLALMKAVNEGRIDVVATDHAPHTLEEKNNSYFKAPSGGPLIQHSLPLMFELALQGKISKEQIIEKMCHNMALCFGIERRGFIRKGYFADLAIINTNKTWSVDKSNILYKCGWSPLEGTELHASITHTFVNGNLIYENGFFDETQRGTALTFNR